MPNVYLYREPHYLSQFIQVMFSFSSWPFCHTTPTAGSSKQSKQKAHRSTTIPLLIYLFLRYLPTICKHSEGQAGLIRKTSHVQTVTCCGCGLGNAMQMWPRYPTGWFDDKNL